MRACFAGKSKEEKKLEHTALMNKWREEHKIRNIMKVTWIRKILSMLTETGYIDQTRLWKDKPTPDLPRTDLPLLNQKI